MPRPYFIGHVINLLTSFLFIYGGQAHLTDRYTPDLARGVGRMLGGVRWVGLEGEQLRTIFGISAITVALLLIIPRTSRIALRLAVGFTCLGAYSAWYHGGPMGPHWTILGVQVVGLLTN